MIAASDEMFVVGTVTGTHGLRGDLKVRPVTGDSSSMLDAVRVYLRKGGGAPECFEVARCTLHKGNALLRLKGREHINQVEDLVGCEVLIPSGELAALDADEYYWFELQGLKVVDRERGELGTLQDMFTTSAHDIYVVRGGSGEVLIPAVEEMILEVDLEGGRMLVELPEGLLPEHNEI